MRVRALLSCAAAATLFAAPSVLPNAAATAPDPALPGSHTVTEIAYDAGPVLLKADVSEIHTGSDNYTLPKQTPPRQYPQELQGLLYVPSGFGPFPVVLFLHGNFGSCDTAGVKSAYLPDCPSAPPAAEPIRSYEGYSYLGRNLASHGYLVMSVDARAIQAFENNGAFPRTGVWERSQLIEKSLDLLAAWNAAPAAPPASLNVGDALFGRVDLSRVGLFGHSRGGEGVQRFVQDERERAGGPKYPGVQAVFALAPSSMSTELAYGVHFGTLLPLCDGDASALPGTSDFDDASFVDPAEAHARVQYTVVGANHNYFNEKWTFDDYGNAPLLGPSTETDPACLAGSPTTVRLAAPDQRDVGLVLMAAFFRRFVGAETALDPLVKGAEPLPASACPGAATTCPGLVGTSYLAPAANRLMVVKPASLTTTDTGRPLVASGFATYSSCSSYPDSCPHYPTAAHAKQLTLGWSGTAALAAGVSAGGTDVSAFDALTFRAGVNYLDTRNTTGSQDFTVTVRDALGGSATVDASGYTNALASPAGGSSRKLTLNGAWVPLGAFGGVDLTRVTAVELGFGALTASGSIQLAQVAFQK